MDVSACALCAVLHSFDHWFFRSVLVLLWCCRWTRHTWKDACSFNMCGTPVCCILFFPMHFSWLDRLLLLFIIVIVLSSSFLSMASRKIIRVSSRSRGDSRKKKRSHSWYGNHVWECCLNWALRAWIWHTSGAFNSRNIICIHKSQENGRNSSNARRNGILCFFGGETWAKWRMGTFSWRIGATHFSRFSRILPKRVKTCQQQQQIKAMQRQKIEIDKQNWKENRIFFWCTRDFRWWATCAFVILECFRRNETQQNASTKLKCKRTIEFYWHSYERKTWKDSEGERERERQRCWVILIFFSRCVLSFLLYLITFIVCRKENNIKKNRKHIMELQIHLCSLNVPIE